jgi:hypothetical protein
VHGLFLLCFWLMRVTVSKIQSPGVKRALHADCGFLTAAETTPLYTTNNNVIDALELLCKRKLQKATIPPII